MCLTTVPLSQQIFNFSDDIRRTTKTRQPLLSTPLGRTTSPRVEQLAARTETTTCSRQGSPILDERMAITLAARRIPFCVPQFLLSTAKETQDHFEVKTKAAQIKRLSGY